MCKEYITQCTVWMDRLGNLSIGILQTLPGSLLRALCSDRNFCIFTNWAKTTCDEPYGSPDTYHAELGHLWWAPRVLTSNPSPFSPDAIESRPRLEICNYPSGFRIISSSHVSERCKRPIFPSCIKISLKKRKRKKIPTVPSMVGSLYPVKVGDRFYSLLIQMLIVYINPVKES